MVKKFIDYDHPIARVSGDSASSVTGGTLWGTGLDHTVLLFAYTQ